jgi:colicin import membrane protein
MSQERSNTMTKESLEQLKAKLKSEDEEKEEAFQKRLEEIREGQAEVRAEREAKERAEQKERRKLLEDARQRREQEMKYSARSSWLDAGGRAEEFEEEWSSLRTEMLKRRTFEAETNARAAHRRSGVSRL